MPPWEPVITHHTRTHFLTHAYTVVQWPLLQSLSLVSHRRRITLKVSHWVSILALPSSSSMLWAKEIGGLSVRPPIWFFLDGWDGLAWRKHLSFTLSSLLVHATLYSTTLPKENDCTLHLFGSFSDKFSCKCKIFLRKKRKVAGRYIKLAH